MLGTPLIDSGIASQLRPGDDSETSDLEGSVIENLSKKWRDISYTHGDALTAEQAPALSADPATADLFSIDTEDDPHAQVLTFICTHFPSMISSVFDHILYPETTA